MTAEIQPSETSSKTNNAILFLESLTPDTRIEQPEIIDGSKTGELQAPRDIENDLLSKLRILTDVATQEETLIKILNENASIGKPIAIADIIKEGSPLFPQWARNYALISRLIYHTRKRGLPIVREMMRGSRKSGYYIDNTKPPLPPLPTNGEENGSWSVGKPPKKPYSIPTPELEMQIDQPLSIDSKNEDPIPPEKGFPVFSAPEKRVLPAEKESPRLPYMAPLVRAKYLHEITETMTPTDRAAGRAIIIRSIDNPISGNEWLKAINEVRVKNPLNKGFIDSVIDALHSHGIVISAVMIDNEKCYFLKY